MSSVLLTAPVSLDDPAKYLPFQLNYKFTCYHCLNAEDGSESYKLTKGSWVESIIGGFSNMSYNTQRDMFKVRVSGRVAHHTSAALQPFPIVSASFVSCWGCRSLRWQTTSARTGPHSAGAGSAATTASGGMVSGQRAHC